MIRVGMIEANNILTALAPLALNAHEFTRIDVVPVLRRIGAGVAAACCRGHDSSAVIVHAAEQHAAALVWISLFPVAAKSFMVLGCNLQHRWFLLLKLAAFPINEGLQHLFERHSSLENLLSSR